MRIMYIMLNHNEMSALNRSGLHGPAAVRDYSLQSLRDPSTDLSRSCPTGAELIQLNQPNAPPVNSAYSSASIRFFAVTEYGRPNQMLSWI